MRKLLCYGVMSPKVETDNRGVAEGEDGYFNGTTGLPVGIHYITKLLRDKYLSSGQICNSTDETIFMVFREFNFK